MSLISVIMPVFNGEEYIRESIDSVLSQKNVDLELIIVNDGSTDNTEKIIKNYGSKIKYFYQDKSNQAAAMNRAIEIAKGKYVAYLDSDDICVNNRLKKQHDFLEKNISIGLVYSAYQNINQYGKNLEIKYPTKPDRITLLYENYIPHSTVMHRKEIFSKAGNFDISYRNQDWDLYVRFSEHVEFALINEVLIKYRSHNSNTSRSYHRKLNHYRLTRLIMLEKTYLRREKPKWMKILIKRAKFEWWLLKNPFLSELSHRVWWHMHKLFNFFEIKIIKIILKNKNFK